MPYQPLHLKIQMWLYKKVLCYYHCTCARINILGASPSHIEVIVYMTHQTLFQNILTHNNNPEEICDQERINEGNISFNWWSICLS